MTPRSRGGVGLLIALVGCGPSLPGPTDPLVATPEGAVPAPPVSAPASTTPLGPEVAVDRLPNGLTVWVLPRATGHVAVGIGTRLAREPLDAHHLGWAQLLNELMIRTDRRRNLPGGPLRHLIDPDGAYFVAGTDADRLDALLGRMAGLVRQPALVPGAFNLVRRRMLDGLRDMTVSERSRARVMAWNRAFRGRPMAWRVHPPSMRASLRNLDLDDLRALHRQVFVPEETVLVVTGDVDSATVGAAVADHFGDWGPGAGGPFWAAARTSFDPPRAPVRERPIHVVPAWTEASYVGLTLLGPGRQSRDDPAAGLLTSVIGGLASSRLNTRIRTLGSYAYGAHADRAVYRDASVITLWTIVQPEDTGRAFETFEAVLAEVSAEGVSGEELAVAQTVHDAHVRSRWSVDLGAATALVEEHLLGGDPTGVEAHRRANQTARLADLQRVAAELFHPSRYGRAVEGPEGEVARALAGAGYREIGVGGTRVEATGSPD